MNTSRVRNFQNRKDNFFQLPIAYCEKLQYVPLQHEIIKCHYNYLGREFMVLPEFWDNNLTKYRKILQNIGSTDNGKSRIFPKSLKSLPLHTKNRRKLPQAPGGRGGQISVCKLYSPGKRWRKTVARKTPPAKQFSKLITLFVLDLNFSSSLLRILIGAKPRIKVAAKMITVANILLTKVSMLFVE